MQPGDMVVARLARGAGVVRVIEDSGSRVTLALGGNRQARLPADRILLRIGPAAGDEELDEFRSRAHEIAAAIDLAEVWEVVRDEAVPMSASNLAELYWGSSAGSVETAGLVIHVDQGSDFFVHGKEGFTARSVASVEDIQARRRRGAANADDQESLMASLSAGRLPTELTDHQTAVLRHLRAYAIHGDDYSRSQAARSLLEPLAGRTRDLQERCFELLARAGVLSEDEPLELHRADIHERFPDDALSEAAGATVAGSATTPERQDLTTLATLTIDDASTVDRDDALSLEVAPGGSDQPPWLYRVGVHVADVGALIPRGSAVDVEANRRMSSLYLPERTIPMLPPDLTRVAGSLDPGEPRLAVSLLVELSAFGEIVGWHVSRSMLRSRAALDYAEADRALDDESRPWHQTLTRLDQIANARRVVREAAGAVNLDQPEMAIKVDSSGEVDVRVMQRSGRSRRLVGELMIMCNSLLAELCRREGLPAAYRAQAAPDLSDVPAPGGQDGPDAASETLRRYLVGRRLRPASLGTEPSPHAGLGVAAYLQATSPLRRYPDLVIQRQISCFLDSGQPLYTADEVSTLLHRANTQLREIAKVEGERNRYWFLKSLLQTGRAGVPEDPRGRFAAVVLENRPDRKALLELMEYPFRFRAEIQGDLSPGDTATLRLAGVDLWRRLANFVQA